jgi:hypothetical protein
MLVEDIYVREGTSTVKSEALSQRPAGSWPIAVAEIVVARPCCYFCGYDKSNRPLRPRADCRMFTSTKVGLKNTKLSINCKI